MGELFAKSRFFGFPCVVSGLIFAVVTSGCSVSGISHHTHEAGESQGYRQSVGEIFWEWRPPRDAGYEAIREFGEGVLVLLSDGVVALSGETGEELWSYRDRGQEFSAEVTGNDEYVALYNWEEKEAVVLEKSTGQVIHTHDIDLGEIDYTHVFGSDSMVPALRGVTGNSWVVRWEDSVSSYDLSTGESLWSVSNVPNCSDVGQVDDLIVQKDVVVAATTCFEHPEDKDTVALTPGHEFTSELVGLSPDTGEEIWRVEHSVGEMPHESLERTISSRPGGLVHIDFNYRSLGNSLLDIESREATHLDTLSLIWTSSDGSQVGLWDTETGEYLIQDRSGANERTLEPETKAEGVRVGLEGGMLHLNEWTEDASAAEGFARFEGFDGSTTFTWDKNEGLSVSR